MPMATLCLSLPFSFFSSVAYFQGVELTETEEPEFKAKVSGCLKNPDSKFFSFDAVARLILKLLLFFLSRDI